MELQHVEVEWREHEFNYKRHEVC